MVCNVYNIAMQRNYRSSATSFAVVGAADYFILSARAEELDLQRTATLSNLVGSYRKCLQASSIAECLRCGGEQGAARIHCGGTQSLIAP